jgi:steroid delta-isomerase-like uncharacterized protein
MGVTREEVMNIVERLYLMWNTQNFSLAPELYTEDYCGVDITDHSRVNGPEGVVRQLERFCRAFPDLMFSNEETILENDRVALYWTAHGTHQGTLLNIPPTGRHVQVNGVSMLRLANGKITHSVHLWDLAGLLRELGLLPELEARAPLDTMSLKDALTICG